MKATEFIHRLDEARIVDAIQRAERSTSGEIRVFVSRRALGKDDVLARAAVRFQKLGMTATRERNGVLIYFVPSDQRFAILGDIGIHEKCGKEFWGQIASGVREYLKRGEFTDAVVEAVRRTGEALAHHFPRRPDDRDELSNEVLHD